MNLRKKIELIEKSVEKWENIVDGTGVDHGTQNCPLCQEFYDDNCEGCPVAEETGYDMCQYTPYFDWDEYCTNNDNQWPYKVFDKISKELAIEERDYLIKLLEVYEDEM